MNSKRPAHTDNTDIQLNAVLGALNTAQPSLDLNRRLLTVLADGFPQSARPQPTPRRRPWRHFEFSNGALAAGCALLVLPLYLAIHPNHSPRRGGAHSHSHPNSLTPNAGSSSLGPPFSAQQRAGSLPPMPTVVIHTTPPATHLTATLRFSTGTQITPEKQALADLHTLSFPAPILPPTAQERLVRLMLRRGEKHDLAQLDGDREPDLQRGETAAFRNFFEPSANTQENTAFPQEKPSSTETEKASQP